MSNPKLPRTVGRWLARELARRVVENQEHARQKEPACGFLAEAALREALVGNLALAKRQVEDALKLTENPYTQATAAIVLRLTGDTQKAARIADALAQRLSENTGMQFQYLPMVRAAIAMRGGNGAKAVDAFGRSATYELGGPQYMSYIRLYPVYVHGMACLSARQGVPAAAQFQKIIDRRGVVQNEPIGALAHLGLGARTL